MNVFIDADAVVQWEKGEFDLLAWIEARPHDLFAIPATAWQQLLFGTFAWEPGRAQKRARHLAELALPVTGFSRRHAARAARIAADLKSSSIGFADCQIAATALEQDEAELLTFNVEHFSRVPGLHLATP